MAIASTGSTRPLHIGMAGCALTVGVLAQALPFGTLAGIPLSPVFPFMMLFYWAVHRPECCPHWMAFLAGLFQDVISGGPPGLWALTYLAVFEGAVRNRLFFVGRAAYSDRAGFVVAAAAAAMLAWVLACLYFWRLLSPLPVLGQMALTALLYPLMANAMAFVDRLTAGNDAS